MKKFDIQYFAANLSNDPSAVVGHRFFISPTPLTGTDLPEAIVGVRSTPDLGSAQNTVEANHIGDISERNVLGLYPASELEYTYWLTPELVDKLTGFIGKDMWIYEERQNMTSTPAKLGNGITYKVNFGGLVATGQSPEGLQEMTQSAVLKSEEFYYVYVDNSTDTPSLSYKGMQTGKVVSVLS